MQTRLKVAGTIIVLLSLALPIEQFSANGWLLPRVYAGYDSNGYLLGRLAAPGPGLLSKFILLVIFVWPVLWLALTRWRRGGTLAGVVFCVGEAILVPLSILAILVSSNSLLSVSRPGPGAYVGILGFSLYAAGAAWADVTSFRAWRQVARNPAPRPQ